MFSSGGQKTKLPKKPSFQFQPQDLESSFHNFVNTALSEMTVIISGIFILKWPNISSSWDLIICQDNIFILKQDPQEPLTRECPIHGSYCICCFYPRSIWAGVSDPVLAMGQSGRYKPPMGRLIHSSNLTHEVLQDFFFFKILWAIFNDVIWSPKGN